MVTKLLVGNTEPLVGDQAESESLLEKLPFASNTTDQTFLSSIPLHSSAETKKSLPHSPWRENSAAEQQKAAPHVGQHYK